LRRGPRFSPILRAEVRTEPLHIAFVLQCYTLSAFVMVALTEVGSPGICCSNSDRHV